ncbi:winged helix DNA-binding domain-containing protein [Phytohabitans sp. ZYX-F-186]|uniref:Winged helix DNA-binding domain-containing protein n=1 Tax=Phytohabitans maris TaxID=3071409 RepID=A0ABU0ZGJ9_9ACTN|nr:winged helix DNA-binding domain-containing protein [Phytohabitans sp. ZYX-F-186]MDQ7906183.1 winged helix DNA-binding domain-containing protein [Phytohabitans sp. ZYX-F-186]
MTPLRTDIPDRLARTPPAARRHGGAVKALTWAQVVARRLERHGLAAPATDLPAAVSAMCGAHAQVMSAAEASIGVRVAGATRLDVRRALWAERTLVKTRGPRGTVHLLATADLPMWTGALGALPSPPYATGANALMTPAQVDRVVAAVGAALADAELTSEELTAEVVARCGPWAGERVMEAFQDRWPRWMQAMEVATRRGAMCFGPNRGRQTTYTSPARWLPGFQAAPPDQALSTLVRHYLHGYGPATPAHFAKWLAIGQRTAQELFAAAGLEEVTVDGAPAWVVAGDTDMPAGRPRGVRLLPYFDAYAIGCHPRDKVFPGRAGERALNRGQAGNFAVLLVDGTVAGIWHQRRSGKRIAVTVEAFGTLSPARLKALGEQVERLGEILEATPTLTLGEVTVGGHA